MRYDTSMRYDYYDSRINKDTIGRYDVTPLFSEPDVFANLIDDLMRPFHNIQYDKVAGIDALGFIIGSAIAQKAGIGFIPIRKGGKLPGRRRTLTQTSFTDYSGDRKSLEMSRAAIRPQERVLIADEWIETGSQMKAAIRLIERLGGEIAGITALCAEKNRRTRPIFGTYDLHAINVVEK